jgi:hypothetical protein
MTRDQARDVAKRLRETADVAEAFADGADVEWSDSDDPWFPTNAPRFSPDLRWRVKPKEPRHLWTVVRGDGSPVEIHNDDAPAKERCDSLNWYSSLGPYTVIHSIEVVP